MRVLKHSCVILAFGFLVAGVWLQTQTAGHVPSHAHHDSTTHASPLCTFFCSAGQIVVGEELPLPANPQAITFLSISQKSGIVSAERGRSSSRGPPLV